MRRSNPRTPVNLHQRYFREPADTGPDKIQESAGAERDALKIGAAKKKGESRPTTNTHATSSPEIQALWHFTFTSCLDDKKSDKTWERLVRNSENAC